MSADVEGQKSVRRVAVIGAGVTGLSAALRLILTDEDVRVVVFEASSRAGGIIQTERRDGFLIEHGPDSFSGKTESGLGQPKNTIYMWEASSLYQRPSCT